MPRLAWILMLIVPSAMPIQAEEIIGKVHSINVKKRQVELADTGIGEKGNILSFDVKEKVRIDEQVGDKRSPLPKGLADIRVGDYLLLQSSSSRGVTYVIRYKSDPRKQ